MKIGYYVEDTAHEAVVHGLAERWCPASEFAPGKSRGRSKQSLRRELPNALRDLRDNHRCDVLVILTDSDNEDWRELKRREWSRVPPDCEHMSVFGVPDRNIECWLAVDRNALANELGCEPEAIPAEDPSGFVKRCFGIDQRGQPRADAKNRIKAFVAGARLRTWVEGSESFADFYEDVRRLATRHACQIPNERNSN